MLPVEVLGEEVLLPRPEAVTTLALKLDIGLPPSRRHTSATHEVAGVYLAPMSDTAAGVALAHPSVVCYAEPDVLREHGVKLLDCRAPVEPLLLGGFCTGYAPTVPSRRLGRA